MICKKCFRKIDSLQKQQDTAASDIELLKKNYQVNAQTIRTKFTEEATKRLFSSPSPGKVPSPSQVVRGMKRIRSLQPTNLFQSPEEGKENVSSLKNHKDCFTPCPMNCLCCNKVKVSHKGCQTDAFAATSDQIWVSFGSLLILK